ncbi:MAG TPA: hypothetical protein VGZ52_09420, partial [Acidimicrobiales bacterium]|nr:hypothetical protein [Acidimicrobiales bacterium]
MLEQIGSLDARWLVVAVLVEALSFVCCWELQCIVLRRRHWRDVAAPQLAGNAVSQVVPGGGPVGAALQLRMLVRSGSEVPAAVAG